jgi:hypothetical protein
MISWKTYTDSGYPAFVQSDEEMSIVCGKGDRGRWLGDHLEPLIAGDKLTVMAQARSSAAEDVCATLLLVWWKNEPGYVFHSSEHFGEVCGQSTEFKQFVYDFVVPKDVKQLRIDLRAWSGAGTSVFKDIRVVKTEEPDPDEPTIPPDHQLTISLDLVTVRWRITASVDSVTALRIPREES